MKPAAAEARTERATARPTAAGPPSFEQAAADHLDSVYRYALHMTGDDAIAEEVAALTFEKAFRRWGRYDPDRASVLTWLCAIARNVSVDLWRAERRRRRGDEAWAHEGRRWVDGPTLAGLSTDLAAALAGCSATEREVVALRVLLDLGCEEAAGVIGITPTACSTYLHRALNRMRAELEAR